MHPSSCAVVLPDGTAPALIPRRLLLMIAFLAAVGWCLAVPPAQAAGDSISNYTIDYQLDKSGLLHVQETIDYQFANSGRHGIDRILVTREKWDDKNDAVYTISNISVNSPSGAPDSFSTTKSVNGREGTLRIRIGDPDRTLSSTSATYVLSYDVQGAVRDQKGFDELYWDATGSDWDAVIRQLNITATVPGGAQGAECFSGPVQSKNTCDSATESKGVAHFAASNVAAGDGVTIGVKVKDGLVSNNTPDLQPDGSRASRLRLLGVVGMTVVAAIASVLGGMLWWRRNGQDERYIGLAPGTVPLRGTQGEVGRNDPDIEIPVAFSPPKIPVAEAGLLIDGQVDTRETAATIIDLAVRGALRVNSDNGEDVSVTLVDPNRAAAPHEMVLMTNLFGGRPPGATADLSARGSMLQAHQALVRSVQNQVTARHWFTKVPSAATSGGIGFSGMALVVIGYLLLKSGGGSGIFFLLPLLPIVIVVLVLRSKLRRGKRTADGRAVCDQVDGFRIYLATAEADQLRFEEGEDIFSRYLPWAIMYELADRWARICADLVAAGRIPDVQPYWYSGNFNMAFFSMGMLTNSLATAATPVQSASSSGTGFGGGSAFGGGGFAGGGGGGGGGGSW